jgi:hypothetical protein
MDNLVMKLDGPGASTTAGLSALPSKRELIEYHKARNLAQFHHSQRHSSVDRAKQTRKNKMKLNGNEAVMLMKPMNPDSRFF